MKKFRTKWVEYEKDLYIITFIFVLVGVFMFLDVLDKKATPIILNLADNETSRLTTLIINRAFANATEITYDELVYLDKDASGNILAVNYKSGTVNKILEETTETVQMYLTAVENGDIEFLQENNVLSLVDDNDLFKKGIVSEVPLGVVTGNTLLYNYGPSVLVRYKHVGDVCSKVKTTVSEYGLNNALIEIMINIEVRLQVMIPLENKEVVVSVDVPVVMQLIQGQVPNYYKGEIENNSNTYESENVDN